MARGRRGIFRADPGTPAPMGARARENASPARDETSYAQPTPTLLYIHDDLTDEIDRRLGPASDASALARRLIEVVAQHNERVRVLTLAEQIDRVVAQGSHAPFDLAVGIGRAGHRVASALHARTGW